MPSFFSYVAALVPLCLLSHAVQGAPASAASSSAIALIRNNIDLYNVLLDTKNYTALDQVFTPDVSPLPLGAPPGVYPNNLMGLEEYVRDSLGNAITLAYSATQYVELGPAGNTATAISYGQSVYFAPDATLSGQIATIYTEFTDDFVLQGGRWLSRRKAIAVKVYCLSLLFFFSLLHVFWSRVKFQNCRERVRLNFGYMSADGEKS